MSSTAARASRVRVARWLLASAIFGSTMAIGGVHVPVLAATTVVLVASVALMWWGAEPLRARRSASLVLWTGVGLTTWTALSVVPLPASWLAHLSPHAADIWARCLMPLGHAGPDWVTLSLDPGATRIQVLRGVAYVATFLAASRISARREGVVFLERALVITALALAAAALLHPALGAEKVFGIYSPRRDPGARHVAPILNPNVLSGYLNIGLSIMVGQLLAPRSLWPRSLLASLTVALIAGQVWIASRGGVLASGLSVVLVIWMSRTSGSEVRGVLSRLVVPAALAVVGIGAGVLAASEGAMGELATTETSKLDLARVALRIVPDFPVFGVGRGAFESVFPAYRIDPTFVVYTHPENIVAQWLTEWGLPSAVAIIVLLVALQPATALARSPRAAGAWAALVSVSAQNLVDFGSEYPAVMIALATCAAIVTGGTSGTDEPPAIDVWARRPARLSGLVVLAAAVSLVLVAPDWKHDLFEDRLSLHAAALDTTVSRAVFESRAEAAMLRHPAEPYLPFTGALRAVRTNESSLLPWIERTLDRALVYGPAHMVLARWLMSRSPSQARLEYRLTLEQAPELATYVWRTVPYLVHGFDDVLELVPARADRTGWLSYISTTLAPRLPATARRLDDLVSELDSNDRTSAEHRARDALADVVDVDAAPWCLGPRRLPCLRDAELTAARFAQLVPSECLAHSIQARIILEAGDPARALRDLRAAADTVVDRTRCLEDLADLAVIAHSGEVLTQALDRVAHAGCVDTAECVEHLEFVARHETARGNQRTALAAVQRAEVLAPDNDGLLEQGATLAARVDLHVEALKSYQTLAMRHPEDPRWTAAIAAEKLELTKGANPE